VSGSFRSDTGSQILLRLARLDDRAVRLTDVIAERPAVWSPFLTQNFEFACKVLANIQRPGGG